MILRPATEGDGDAIWSMLEPVFRSGLTYAIDRDIPREAALAYWRAERAYVTDDLSGTFYLRRNQGGGGAHVANAGFVVAPGAEGRGIARAMLRFCMDEARRLGFEAMQFNFVLASNVRAVRLWQSEGFAEIGRIPDAFRLPDGTMTDALVMHRFL